MEEIKSVDYSKTENLVKTSEKLEPSRDEKGRLLPGRKSLNPAGNSKGTRHLTTLLEEALRKVAEGSKDPQDIIIIEKVIQQAKEGDMRAIEHIWDRVEGKAPQTIKHEGEIGSGLSVEDKAKLDILVNHANKGDTQ